MIRIEIKIESMKITKTVKVFGLVILVKINFVEDYCKVRVHEDLFHLSKPKG
jgi:hypothetical protein